MGTRTFNILVVIFWLCAVSWLLVKKVVPELRRGTPPSYRVLEANEPARESLVCWTIELLPEKPNPDQPPERLGWAASRAMPLSAGRTELQSRVQLWKVPLSSLGPMMRGVLGFAGIDEKLEVSINSKVHLDTKAKLDRFESQVRLGNGLIQVGVSGVNQQGQLEVFTQRNKEAPQPAGTFWLGDESDVGDGNAPNGYMPDLKVGQSWKTHQFNALKAGMGSYGSSEELEATVERKEEMIWDGHRQTCWLVEFRRDPGAGTRFVDRPQRQIWVRVSDGKVLRDETQFLNRRLRFVRVQPAHAERLAAALAKDWSTRISEDVIPR